MDRVINHAAVMPMPKATTIKTAKVIDEDDSVDCAEATSEFDNSTFQSTTFTSEFSASLNTCRPSPITKASTSARFLSPPSNIGNSLLLTRSMYWLVAAS